MSNFRSIPQEIKDQILNRIKTNGEAVSTLAAEYHISIKTIYYWLGKKTDASISVLEYARLKRENKLLLELVGRLTLENNVKKK
jgi:transposase-like protein